MKTLNTVMARGVNVTYLTSGHGPKSVILLHGWGSNPWVWEGFMNAAPADEYCVVAPAFWGDSDRPWGGSNVSGIADEVRDLMDALDISTATLGGHAWGGIVAQLFALRYLDRLDKLILCATGPTTKNHSYLPGQFEQLQARGKDRASLKELIGRGYGTLPPPEVFEHYIDHIMKAPIQGLIEAMESGMKYDFTPWLRYITVPALIVQGRYDKGRVMSQAEAFKSGLPSNQLAVLECGHYPQEELPEEFNAAVLKFLSE